MKVQKLANLKQLQEKHRQAVHAYFFGDFIWQVVISLLVCSVGCYFLISYPTSVPFYEWFIPSLIMAFCLLVPLVKMSIPPAPTQADVDANRALRRVFNMDDSVDDE